MKIGDLKFKRHVLFSFMLLVFGAGVYGQNPTLPSSTANASCASCVPAGWQKGPGTPDISNATTAATAGSVIGAVLLGFLLYHHYQTDIHVGLVSEM